MNFLFTFIGWFGWNWFEFTNAKDIADDKDVSFDFGVYIKKKWDNWIWTLIVAGTMLLIGHNNLGMDLVKTFDERLVWSDLYYFASGFISELVSFAYRKFKKKELTEK